MNMFEAGKENKTDAYQDTGSQEERNRKKRQKAMKLVTT